MGNFLQSQKTKLVLGALGLYLLSAGISYFAFGALKTSPVLSPAGVDNKRSKVDVSAPKTEECPLNGQMYTKAEREIWEKRAPLGVMIENHVDSRPQSGLSRADVIYEALAEGGVTRFMAVYYCGASAEEVQIGPVRSARIYYMDWISEYGRYPLYAHVGGANRPGPSNALGAIKDYGWENYNDLNQFSIGFPTFWRDYERFDHPVATEHTMYSTTDKLWAEASERGITNEAKKGVSWDEDFVSWSFVEGKPSTTPTAGKINYSFWEGVNDFSVEWNYDSTTNTYKRINGGDPHMDMNFENVQLSPSNVVVMFDQWRPLNDPEKHILYATTSGGKALVFQNGTVTEGKWTKESRTARTKFTDKKGKEIGFVKGQIWISVLDPAAKVVY